MMDIIGSSLSNMGLGLSVALTAQNLIYCFIGVFLGMVVGVIPGIGALAAIAMLFPLTFNLDSTAALIMLAGLFYGTSYGGSTASILLNVPGNASSAVVCLDGYPMSQQGRAGIALLLCTLSSFIGGSIGIVLMMLFSPAIVAVALSFGAAEYFALMVLGLVAASTISEGSAIKGIAMVVLGVLFGVVGMDMYTGTQRFTFGIMHLTEGVSLVALAMGIFGLTEVIASARKVVAGQVKKVTMRSMIPTKDDWSRFWGPTLRGSGIGAFFGALPGTGGSIASFVSYAVERRVAKEPERFGKGAVEGVISPEASNNTADQTAFIPTMTLGIPGSPSMALILGVLIMQGITPGPQLMVNHPEMFWGVVMSFWIGNVMLLVLNIPLIGLWVRMLQIPYPYLYPAIVMFICIGVYSVNNSVVDVYSVLVLGVLGYVFRVLGFPAAPMLLGFVLGPLLEENFRRAMIISSGDFTAVIARPLAGSLLAVAALILIVTIVATLRNRKHIPLPAED